MSDETQEDGHAVLLLRQACRSQVEPDDRRDPDVCYL